MCGCEACHEAASRRTKTAPARGAPHINIKTSITNAASSVGDRRQRSEAPSATLLDRTFVHDLHDLYTVTLRWPRSIFGLNAWNAGYEVITGVVALALLAALAGLGEWICLPGAPPAPGARCMFVAYAAHAGLLRRFRLPCLNGEQVRRPTKERRWHSLVGHCPNSSIDVGIGRGVKTAQTECPTNDQGFTNLWLPVQARPPAFRIAEKWEVASSPFQRRSDVIVRVGVVTCEFGVHSRLFSSIRRCPRRQEKSAWEWPVRSGMFRRNRLGWRIGWRSSP